MNKIFAIFSIFSLLAACDASNTQTKDWYKQHAAERHTRVASCKDNAKDEQSADCQNAINAQSEVYVFGS